MSILNRYAGFEDLELNGTDGTTTEHVEAIAEDAARAEVAELQVELEQQGQEIEELKADIAEQDEAVEEVQELVEGMESLIGSGSFNSTAFASLYNRASKLNSKLGGTSVDRMGVEALGDAGTAQIMARHGLESFTDTIKGWAKKAIEAIKHIFNTVINFFVGIFSAAEKLTRRADQLSQRLEKAEKLKEKVKLGGWNAYFDYEKNGLNRDPEGWNATNNAISQFANMAKSVSKIELSTFNGAYASLEAALKKDTKTEVNATEKKEGDKKVLIGMSAGIRVHAEMKDGTAKDLKEAAEFARSIKIHFSTGDVKKLTSGEVAAKGSKDVLKSTITGVKQTVTNLRNGKVSAAFSKAQRDQVIGSLNVLKADDKEKSEDINNQIAVVRAVFSTSAAITQAVNKQTVRAANWSLDAVAAHI